jgi:cell division protein FtsI (penicillin-binding protein 3)
MIRSSRIGLAHSVLALFAVAILVQAARVQLVQGRGWRAQAERQQTTDKVVPAHRGDILDVSRRVLAQSHEVVRIEIAPREVNERRKLKAALAKLRVDPAIIARALDTTNKYLVVQGRFRTSDAAQLVALRGVHSFASIERTYAVSEGAKGILGNVDADNKPVGGLEQSLDSLLRGKAGTATMVRDSRGRGRESPTAPGTAPVSGNSIVLTLNADLQEIAEKALADAVARMGAEGGDIVIVDPHTGEIRAMASRRPDPRQTAATVLTEPFEPGSTFKPFMAAALIDRARVTDADSVDTGNGVLEIDGRKNPIRDDHFVGKAPLSVVLRWSSNIGIVKFSSRLTPREKYETIRDFGFGTPTGLPYPTESGGILRAPKNWSAQSPISLPMGYEVSVTPLQLALAYSTFANGGELVEPSLVKQIIGPDGSVVYEHQRRVVRRVVSKATADKIRHMLLDVVDEGTAAEAAIDNFMLAGKTGTPRSTVRGHYVAGRYNPNFVGIFPADNPQYVIVVKMTAPQSSIYAAQTAAPVTKVILQAAIAARDAALDRAKLATSVHPKSDTVVTQLALNSSLEDSGVARRVVVSAGDTVTQGVPFVVSLPAPPDKPARKAIRPVPDIHGLGLRGAVRTLHSAGFRVQVARGASGSPATSPAAGELAPTGTVVRLLFDY